MVWTTHQTLTVLIVRREETGDEDDIRAVHDAAFARSDVTPTVESGLVDALRSSDDWIPRLSLVAELDGVVVGSVVGSRGVLVTAGGEIPAVGLGPIGVLPAVQRRGVGGILVHTLLAAAEALDEPLVCLLGDPDYYRRFGFRPAAQHGIAAPEPAWGEHFQVRRLHRGVPQPEGTFRYARAFEGL